MTDATTAPRIAAGRYRRLLASWSVLLLFASGAAAVQTDSGHDRQKVDADSPDTNAPPNADLDVSTPDSALDASTALSAIRGGTDWNQRVSDLAQQIEEGEVERSRADVLYNELAKKLWVYQAEVDEALRSGSPDALDRRAKLASMYLARVRLLEWVTPRLRAQLTGATAESLTEIKREFANARLDFRFQALAIPRGLHHVVETVRDSPVTAVWRLVELLLGIAVFRIWRRWARTGLGNIRKKALSVRPRTDVHLHIARLVWYVQRFRAPLEWLALIAFVRALFDPGDLVEVTSLIWIILLWTLLTRFGLLLVDALASGSTGTRNGSGPRLRSLRLVAGWILLTGLGLDLTSRYVGEATIHAWATRTFLLLLIPIGLLLLHWWRTPIIQRLESDSSFSNTARRMGKNTRGIASYLNAAAGAIYILGAELLQLSIRFASRFESGRKLVATLLRREVERDAQREHIAEKRISEELALELLTADDTVIDGPFREPLERIKEFAKTERGASIAVLAERGGGLATFLRLLKDDIGESMRIVDCPPGGPEKFTEALAAEFGLNDDSEFDTKLRSRLDEAGVRIVALSNYHRVARPKRGGLAGMIRAAEIIDAAGGHILWVFGLTSASWPYINRMLGDRAILHEILELPPWSEAQLEQLFDARCKKAEIEPDYRRLDFPRQFDDGERETLEERNRFGFRRVVWELADGNPEVAIRLFVDSLRELPSGKLIVRLPQPSVSTKIANASRTTLLILKVLVETEMSTIDDLEASIREPRSLITSSIAYCIQQGWVEEIYDHYQIAWPAYRMLKRVLVRRALIPR